MKNSQTKTHLYDGLDMLKDGASTFLNGVGIDEPLSITNGGTTQTILDDHLGSTGWLSSSTGAFQTRYDYSSYGKPEAGLANPSASNALTYTAREDDGTGLMYYRARYYDPSLERFISDDPLGDAQRYVGGMPTIATDPLGLELGLYKHEDGTYGPTENWYNALNNAFQLGARVWMFFVGDDICTLASPSSSLNDKLWAGSGFIPGEKAGQLGLKAFGKVFSGKTAAEIEGMFLKKGFKKVGPDPLNGKGGYVNPETGRSYHIDPGGQYKKGIESPHVDVNRKYNNPNLSNPDKRKFER